MRYLNCTKRTLKKIHHKRSTKNNKDCFYFSSFISIMFLDYLHCPWSTLNARLDVKYSPQGCRRGNYSIHYSITPYVTSLIRGYRRTKRIKIRRWNIRGDHQIAFLGAYHYRNVLPPPLPECNRGCLIWQFHRKFMLILKKVQWILL